MNSRLTTALSVLCIALGGCYAQAPLTTLPPVPNTHLIAQLSDSGMVSMGTALGSGVVGVEGVVERADPETWVLRMVSATQRDGRVIDWNHEAVSFPSRVLIQPEIRKLDKKRSWLAAGGVAVGAFVLARGFALLGGDENKDTNPPPANILIPGGGK